jgi:hypothetical protein
VSIILIVVHFNQITKPCVLTVKKISDNLSTKTDSNLSTKTVVEKLQHGSSVKRKSKDGQVTEYVVNVSIHKIK